MFLVYNYILELFFVIKRSHKYTKYVHLLLPIIVCISLTPLDQEHLVS